MDQAPAVEAKFKALSARLDEATLRLWAAAEARSLGRGGVSVVAKVAGLSRTTVYAGLAEIEAAGKAKGAAKAAARPSALAAAHKRIRAPGGGRKRLVDIDASLLADLDALVEPSSRGDPMSPLRWTCKSTTRLAAELVRSGHRVSQRTVCDLLAQLNYSLQSVRKTREGAQHPDRDAQFEYIAQMVRKFQRQRQPVISVDTKKKELIGDFKNAGREWHPQGQPEQVRVHDFIDDELGKVAPYGVYDVTANVRVHGVSPSTIRARRALIWQGWAAGSLDQPVGAAATEPVRGIRLGGAVLAMNAWTALCMNSHRSRPWRRQVS